MTHVLDLPDDALLAVLAYLPPRQLFACRVACKRLRDLCLHRFLWRHVTLKYWCNAGLVRAVLVLAPCIKSLECSGGTAAQASRLRTIICVVTELSLYVSGRGEMTLAMAIIRRPPGLRKLHLYLSKFQWSIKPLLQVVHCLDVETLSLDMHAADVLMPAAWCELEVKPSLRELTYYSKTGDSFLLLLLRTHAATLEDVRLHIKNDFPVSALLRIPGLRSIECSPTADLHPLVALPHLHTVVFRRVAFHGAQDYHPGALQFLREALHVRTLNLRFCRHAALMALADSRSAPLIETLSVSQSNWPLLKILPLILPKLTALKVLELSAKPTDAFLQTICPSSAPSLTTLAVVYRGTCLHAWVRSGVVQDLLSMNPCLHLCVAKWNNCSLCLNDFHGELSQPGCPSSFSSHSKTTGCPRDCFKVTA